jgi:hypothetical protein
MALQETKAVNGSDAKGLVSLDGTTYYRIEEIVSMDQGNQGSDIPANSHKFPRREQSLPGRSSGSLTINCNLIRQNEDQGLKTLRQAYSQGLRTVYVKILSELSAGAEKFTVIGYVSSISYSFPDNAVQTANVSFKVNNLEEGVVSVDDINEHGPVI